eukprot:Opistho-2@79088
MSANPTSRACTGWWKSCSPRVERPCGYGFRTKRYDRPNSDAGHCGLHRSRLLTMRLPFLPSCMLALSLLATGCAQLPAQPPTAIEPTAVQLDWGRRVGIAPVQMRELLNKPLFQMKPAEVGSFIAWQQLAEPDFRKRVAALARKNIGQPYELYLLGEFPFETFDSQPLFSLEKSDCVVFAEHIYAMALSASWPEFFWMLQRIRYQDGVIGAATRNHYTEADWNIHNGWLVQDITAQLAGARAAAYTQQIDRKSFLRKQFKIEREIPVQRWDDVYLPKALVAEVADQLQEGDFVNIISGQKGGFWASHVGLIVLGPNGERHILHSAEPMVREESLQAFIARLDARDASHLAAGQSKPQLYGFKFLRLNDRPQVPPMAPQPRPRSPAPRD